MKVHREVMSLFLVLIVCVFVAKCGESQMVSFLINCGTNSTVNVDGRRWIGDASSESNVTLSSPCDEASTTTFNGDPPYAPLYETACVFTNALNYTFRATHGSYFLRLHFHPFSFHRYNANASYFAVEANGVKLVSEFNVLREIVNKNTNSSYSYLVKEYFFSVDDSVIVVSFVPSKGSYGFINAIEIVLEGNEMFIDLVRRVGAKGGDTSLNLRGGGIETMYRLNVGGSSIRPSQDSPFWRSWEADSSYMINSDAGLIIRNTSDIIYANTKLAPNQVYETARTLSNTIGMTEKRFNMSWKLEVDPDFDYLVRLHFCEPGFEKANQRIFRIYIDNKTAAHNFDIYVRAGGVHRAYHEDYLDSVSSHSHHIWVQLGPETSSGSAGTDALLNGLEVFKLSRNNNLAYVQNYNNLEIKKTSRLIRWVGIGVGVASIAILAAICMVFIRFLKKRDVHDTKKTLFLHANSKGSVRQFGGIFTLSEIKEATNGFDGSLVIGEGGFGKVFKGEINEGVLVAIKRSDPQSGQGLAEFKTEVEMLSKLRHRHLVSLIGFCDEQSELVLVYEHMANGTLRSHLYGSDLPPLSWKQRIEVCIGAARGLHYLHTGLDRAIIHRDVKTTNILLDENLVAKVSDFGLSKTGPSLEHTHVSTAVKGSFGYLDPEYFRRQHLTDKSDVYSFGVVLFEVVCARAVINPALPKDQISLAEWALRMQRERLLVSIADPTLKGQYCPQSLIVFGDIAERCVADEGKRRPTMGEVLWHLEHVLRLQDAWLNRNEEDGVVFVDKIAFEMAIVPHETAREDDELGSKIVNEVDPLDPMAVGIDEFSQMIDLKGR